jgi:hypothetical protein
LVGDAASCTTPDDEDPAVAAATGKVFNSCNAANARSSGFGSGIPFSFATADLFFEKVGELAQDGFHRLEAQTLSTLLAIPKLFPTAKIRV